MAVHLLIIEDNRGRTETVIEMFRMLAEAMEACQVYEKEHPDLSGRLNILTIHEKGDE